MSSIATEEDDERYWSKVSPIYDKLYSGRWSTLEDAQVRSWLGTVLGKPEALRVLDLGCGTGLGMSLLPDIQERVEYIGLDISMEMLARLHSKFRNSEVVLGTMSDPSRWPEGPFDLILGLNGVLSFSRTLQSTLAGVRSRISPGGQAFLSLYNRYALRRVLESNFRSSRTFRTRGAPNSYGTVFCTFYSMREIVKAFAAAQLTITNTFHQGVLAGPLEWSNLWPLEERLQRVLPWACHTIYLIARPL